MRLLIFILITGLLAAPAAAESFTLAPELWDRPRSASAVLAEPAVRRAVNAYLAAGDVGLVVHHPPGTRPALQAEELRAWLIALAVDSGRVVLKGDLEPNLMLKIEVVRQP